jgi:hypothetical protein
LAATVAPRRGSGAASELGRSAANGRILVKVLTAYICIASIFILNTVSAEAYSEPSTDEARAAIRQIGTGKDARVQIRLTNGRIVKGHVLVAGNDTFDVFDQKSDQAITIAYSDISEIQRVQMSKAKKFWVGIAVTLGSLFLVWTFISTSD